MAGRVGGSPDEMRGVASQFNTCGDDFSGVVSRMGELKESLIDVWEGRSLEAFCAEFEEVKPKLDAMVELIHDVANQVTASADILEQTDQGIAGQMGY